MVKSGDNAGSCTRKTLNFYGIVTSFKYFTADIYVSAYLQGDSGFNTYTNFNNIFYYWKEGKQNLYLQKCIKQSLIFDIQSV